MSEHSTQVFLGVAAFALHDGRMWWRSVFANNGFLKCSQNNVVGLRNIFCPIMLIFNAVPSAGSKVMGTEHWETLLLNCWTVGNSEYIQKSLHSVLIYMLQCPKRFFQSGLYVEWNNQWSDRKEESKGSEETVAQCALVCCFINSASKGLLFLPECVHKQADTVCQQVSTTVCLFVWRYTLH